MDNDNLSGGKESLKPLLIGKRFFSRPWVFMKSAPAMKFLPPEGPVEIAFAGRSNVGKSSLINALVNQKGLARSSNTPGRTQELNYFIPASFHGNADFSPVAIVDMPGYGFAKVPKKQVEKWTQLIFSYLRTRSALMRVFVLVDARHGLKKNDIDMLTLLDEAAVSYQIAFSKTDKTKRSELERQFAVTRKQIARRPACHPTILATSSQTHSGMDELRMEIAHLVP